MLLLFSGAYAQKIYLVAAGISDYPCNDHDLRRPAKDAKKICWLYQKNKKASTVLLTDSKATKSSILSNIKKQFAKAGKRISWYSISAVTDIPEDSFVITTKSLLTVKCVKLCH